jgi:protein-S-isoprenylcysteine O-methyltransferase Ste14
MDHPMEQAYGLWSLVILNSAIFIIFAFSFFKPQTQRDWRSFGAFSAFIVALFVEMYGFPLTIYLLSGWLGSKYPALDLYSHESGHLWHTLLGLKGDPHVDILHVASIALIFFGIVVLAAAWPILYKAQIRGKLAVTGPYAKIRHPQYAGFTMIMLGFLLQWPTLPTLVLFPILTTMYVRLAKKEESEARAKFGKAYGDYATRVPGFFPKLFSSDSNQEGSQS